MEFKLRTNKKYNSTIEQLLYARGFKLPDEMDLFLYPRNSAEYNYLRLDNIEIAARRILKSLVRQEQVFLRNILLFRQDQVSLSFLQEPGN